MRYLLVLVVLAALVTVASLLLPAAVRLKPRPAFESVEAEGYGVLVGPRNVATTEMTVTYTVRGKKGSTYIVELYVEADGTGEKAQWLRSETVTVEGGQNDDEGTASGEFKVRDRGSSEPDSETCPFLPWANLSLGWSVQLVLKEDKQVFATFGPIHAPFNRKKPDHLPE